MSDEERKADATFGEPQSVASGTECTGLMPALPPDDAANANLAALYGIHRAKGARGKRYRSK